MLFKYILFAILATSLNILVQAVCFQFYDGKFSLQIAIVLGTGIGLIFKFFLDKKYVFSQNFSDLHTEGKIFSLYSLMGIFTTLIFWCFEAVFYYFIHFSWAKYLGAITGLGIGYFIKYHLDKKFVFWGGLNGCALIIHRVYQKIGFRMPRFIAVSVTFIFIMVTWVYFRANEWQDATNILCSMIGLKSGEGVPLFATYLDSPIWIIGVILLFGPNSNQIGDRFKTNSKFLFLLIYLFIVNILFLNSSIKKDFLYFDF